LKALSLLLPWLKGHPSKLRIDHADICAVEGEFLAVFQMEPAVFKPDVVGVVERTEQQKTRRREERQWPAEA
jgi:hypothetical protein